MSKGGVAVPVVRGGKKGPAEVIIRNMPFKMEKPDIEKLFGAFGKIQDIRIPMTNKDGKEKKRGFAFVRFQSHNSAAAVVKKLNGSEWQGRPLVLDVAIGAAEYSKASAQAASESVSEETGGSDDIVQAALASVRERKEVAKDETGEVESSSDEEDESMGEDKEEDEESSVAASSDLSALSDDEEGADAKSDTSSIYASDSDNDEDASSDIAEDDAESEDDEDASSDDEEETKEKSSEEKPARESGHDLDEMKTIFIRNVPFTATEKDLIEAFKRYGNILFAKLVRSKVDGTPRGTAFVKFRAVHSAEKVMEEEKEVQRRLSETGAALAAVARAAGAKAATKAMAAPLEDLGVTLQGRRLILSSAVTPEQATALTAKKGSDEELKGRGKARIIIQKMGLGRIDLEDESALEGMSKADAKRREAAWKTVEMRAGNPNITLNPLRVSVQNLPAHADGLSLREAVCKAIMRSAVARDTVLATALTAGEKASKSDLDELRTWSKKAGDSYEEHVYKKDEKGDVVVPRHLRRAWAAALHTSFPKVHVVKDASRTVEKTEGEKAHRSMGFAFVEAKSESLSAALIVTLNNDANAFGDLKRPVVNFALEDARALREQKKKQEIHEKRKERRAAKEAESGSAKPADPEAKKRERPSKEDKGPSRGQRQREKKRQRRADDESAATAEPPAAPQGEKREFKPRGDFKKGGFKPKGDFKKGAFKPKGDFKKGGKKPFSPRK